MRSLSVENVVQFKVRGRVAYQGHLNASDLIMAITMKMYDDPSGKGYQRPVNQTRADDFARYLEVNECAVVTPIFINGQGNWQFQSYDKLRPNIGRLFITTPGTLIDGQHRIAGTKKYIEQTKATINIPFFVFHYLDDDEEIELFNTINSKSQKVSKSLSIYLDREHDETSWIATRLITDSASPFYGMSNAIGSRNGTYHTTLQNIHRIVNIVFKRVKVRSITKDARYTLISLFYSAVKGMFNDEWCDHRNYRVTHTVGLNALAMVAAQLLTDCNLEMNLVLTKLERIRNYNWKYEGEFRFLNGQLGARTIAEELLSLIAIE